MSIFNLWLAAIYNLAVRLYKGEQNVLPLAMVEAARRGFWVFFAINFVFYVVEKLIWGYGFPHFGDAILMTYLVIELIAVWYAMWQLNKEPKQVSLNA
ncbi:hypothetical protein [Vibrio mediterranei]|uniref:hypothetical protein n=1 Tax=Vibrio mediterranei TaxID=689 RepID=UPI004067FD8D